MTSPSSPVTPKDGFVLTVHVLYIATALSWISLPRFSIIAAVTSESIQYLVVIAGFYATCCVVHSADGKLHSLKKICRMTMPKLQICAFIPAYFALFCNLHGICIAIIISFHNMDWYIITNLQP